MGAPPGPSQGEGHSCQKSLNRFEVGLSIFGYRGSGQSKGDSLKTQVIVAHVLEPDFSLQAPGDEDRDFGVVKGGFTYREYYS
jgi:hypothetical protein